VITLKKAALHYLHKKFEHMKIVRVIYTHQAGIRCHHQANIANIVKELKALNHPGIKYSCYLLPDGKTFMHLDHFEERNRP